MQLLYFVDTRADTSAYSNAGLEMCGDALDQPTTITNYYLQRLMDQIHHIQIRFILMQQIIYKNLQMSTFKSLLQGWIRQTAATSTDGYKITYNLGASGSGE